MADSKTTQLAQLAATPDVADQLMIVDVSDTSMAASGTNKRLAASYIARSDAGAKLITGNGRELTVSATGTAPLLDAQNTFTQAQIIPQIRSAAAVALLDDTATSISLGSAASGIIIFMASLSGVASGMVMFRVGSNLQCVILAQAAGSVLAVATGTGLTGTTGTDGKLTFSAHTDNKLYIENRTGSAFSGLWLIIGMA